jgi:tricorn protease interacting factor F2/3
MQINSYDIFLDIDFKKFEYEGRVKIDLISKKDIILDAIGLDIFNVRNDKKNLQYIQKNKKVKIKTGDFSGVITIIFKGTINDKLVGFYKAPYNETYMLTTHFEAIHARRMFPCKDDPKYKARFKLTLKINIDLNAISNMPIESVLVKNEKKIISFKQTPMMSTYLLYVGIDRFEERTEKLGNINLITATPPGNINKGNFCINVAKKSVEFFQSYFNIPYMIPKLHLIAVPEFAIGAMENWGAITFRESAFYIDKNSSVKNKKRVAELVAHEVSHQWFGNLVTMNGWHDLWLKESFATFMGYKALNEMYPDLKAWETFLVNRTSSAMSRDALRNTHPIKMDSVSLNEIIQIFDEISYDKGASILRMVEAYLGSDAFKFGIRDYLTNNKFSNASSEDFWNSLEKTSGKKVTAIVNEWIRKSGYPVVSVVLDEGDIILSQKRFQLSGKISKDIWPIPITLKLNGKFKKFLMNEKELVIKNKNLESLKLNIDQVGFYRVHYNDLYDLVWDNELSELEQYGIINDAIAFLMAGKMPFVKYLDIVRGFFNEKGYLPILEISNQLNLLYLIKPTKIKKISNLFHKNQIKILNKKVDENSLMLQGILASRLSIVDEVYAKKVGDEFDNYEKIEPNMKEATAIAYARDTGNFDNTLKKYRKCKSDEDRIRLLNALTNFKDPSLVDLSLGLALNGEVKKQDVGSLIMAASRNPDAKKVIWTWFKTNINWMREIYEGTWILSRIIMSVIPIIGIGNVKEVESFFEENQIPEARLGVEVGLERLKIYDKLDEYII